MPRSRIRKRRRWPWIIAAIAAVLACCLTVPVAVIAVPIIRDTIAAGRGSTSPHEALVRFMFTLQPPADAQQLDAERLIVPDRRRTILRQRTEYINAIDATNRTHPDQTARLTAAYDEHHQTQIDIHGDNATVTDYWRAQWDFHETQPGGAIGYTSDPLPWTATAQQDHDGWRLTTITMPSWCGTLRDDGTVTGYAKCT